MHAPVYPATPTSPSIHPSQDRAHGRELDRFLLLLNYKCGKPELMWKMETLAALALPQGECVVLTGAMVIRLMDKILHDPKDSKLWELWYIPGSG